MNYLSIELIKGNAVHTDLSDNQFLNQLPKKRLNIYIFVKSNDLEMRETIEKMDFKYQKTYFRDTSVLLLN